MDIFCFCFVFIRPFEKQDVLQNVCYGVWRPSVNFFVSGLLLQFTSDQAETLYIVRP